MPDYITRKYMEFIDKHGYIPKYFNAYNTAEIKNYSTSLTCNCGSATGFSSILIFSVTKDEKK